MWKFIVLFLQLYCRLENVLNKELEEKEKKKGSTRDAIPENLLIVEDNLPEMKDTGNAVSQPTGSTLEACILHLTVML